MPTKCILARKLLITPPRPPISEQASTFELFIRIMQLHMPLPIVLSSKILLTVRTHMRPLILVREHMRRLVRVARKPLSTAGEIADEFLWVFRFARALGFDEVKDFAGGEVVRAGIGKGFPVGAGGG